MDLFNLGPDIILLHILPLLAKDDIRALAAVETRLFGLLSNVRFRACKVSNGIGFILDYLQPSTLLTVTVLTLNGTAAEQNLVFRSPYMRSVQWATLCGRIKPDQRVTFSVFVRQLRGLTEEQDNSDPDELSSNISFLPIGSLSNLHVLRMELTVPWQLESHLGLARNLRTIQFLPSFNSGATEEEKLDDYRLFVAEFGYLLDTVSNRNLLPPLRLVHTVLDLPTVATHQSLRDGVLESVWTAAAAHGGWRLLAGRTSTVPLNAYPDEWGDWWTEHATDMYLSVNDVKLFSIWCERNTRFPRFDEFIIGRIHIYVPDEFEAAGTLFNTKVYGIKVSLGSTPVLRHAINIITVDTRSIDISLQTNWGDIPSIQFSPRQFQRIETIRITGPPARTPATPPLQYSHNLGGHILSTLGTKNWKSLRAMSIPATSLQKTTPEANPERSAKGACGIHLGGYDLGWLAECGVLEALHITEWCACDGCGLEDDVSLVAGLQHLPSSIKFVRVTGYFCCPVHLVHASSERIVSEMKMVLRERRADVLVDTAGLIFGPE